MGPALAAMSRPVDPLTAKYRVLRGKMLGSGADGGVVRGVVKETGEWHALKFLSSAAYSPQRELNILQKLQHENIVPVLQVFAPAASRQHWVFAMPEADFTLHEFLCRSRGPAASRGQMRNSEAIVRDLSAQLLAGIQCLHEAAVVHRDIKPPNVLLSVACDADGAGGGGGACRLRLWLADFSRARHVSCVRRTRVRQKRRRDETEWPMTHNVCTLIYCAPESLFRAEGLEDEATYGLAVDVWAFGAILFEMLTLQHFCEGETAIECLAFLTCRLGPLVQDVGPRSIGWVDRRPGALPLSDYFDKHIWARSLLLDALHWVPGQRRSAKGLAAVAVQSTVMVAPAVAVAAESEALAASQGFWHALLSPMESPPTTTISNVKCACSGHCYTSGHRWRGGCDCYNLISCSKYCVDCCCEVPDCGRPRLRGSLCSAHRKILDECPPELVLTRAARSATVDFFPCDLECYMTMSVGFEHDIATLILLALMREPTSVAKWISTGLPGKLLQDDITSDALDASLLVVLRFVHENPPTSEMEQLNQQGDQRERDRDNYIHLQLHIIIYKYT